MIHRVDVSRDITLTPVGDRWYRVQGAFTVDIFTDFGRKHIMVDDGLMFDGRSGSSWIDALGIAPNLGTQAELKEFLTHDILYYDIGFTFEEANALLRDRLRSECGYGAIRAGLIYHAVQTFGRSHFGAPAPDEREYPNLAKIHVRHYDK